MRTGLITQPFCQNLRPRRSSGATAALVFCRGSIPPQRPSSAPTPRPQSPRQKPVIFIPYSSNLYPAVTPDNILPFPFAQPLTKIPKSSIITAFKRMWRNWQTHRLQVPAGLTPLEVRLLSSAVEICAFERLKTLPRGAVQKRVIFQGRLSLIIRHFNQIRGALSVQEELSD